MSESQDKSKLNQLLAYGPFELEGARRGTLFLEAMKEVSTLHIDHCPGYAKLCRSRGFEMERIGTSSDIPYVPASLFKNELLLSIPEDKVFREITSSATTSGHSSRMGLDKATSRRQSKCFNRIVVDRIGSERFKFIVLDIPETLTRSLVVQARASTIRSLLFCANEAVPCLDQSDLGLTLDEAKLDELLDVAAESNERIAIFGFTFILYKYVVEMLMKRNRSFNLPNATIIHIGGWKKLEAEKVTPQKLISDCCDTFGVEESDIIDIYGFTEQGGLVYPTCEYGHRHVPCYADVIARDPVTLEALPPNKEGLLQFLTPIQTSYPGHSVLTEDMGCIEHIVDCPCGRNAKAFRMTGRAPDAEIRGCGDIMADKFAR